jgi:ABC-type glycerol-3-phosphate transport system substrate-binding protein
LRVWLPPQFDPNAGIPSAELLKQRLSDFEDQHPGLKIEVRIKSDADITTILSTTSKAAPSAMPDLIALSYTDMQAAASAGFLHPLKGLTEILQDPDWYAFARELGHFQDTEYGFPFASNILLTVYHPSAFEQPLSSWESIFDSGNQMVFPASDPQAYFPLSLYLSAKGKLVDDQGAIILDEEPLVRVLTFYQHALETETIPPSIKDYRTDEESLQFFRDGEADLAVIWASSDISTQSGEYLPLLGLDDIHYSLGDGWVWALAGSGVENQPLAVELASYLVESSYMSAWTRASGSLPTRPQALNEWEDEKLKVSINEVFQSAHPIPSEDVMLVVSPLLQEALMMIFNGEEPDVTAQSVIESMK